MSREAPNLQNRARNLAQAWRASAPPPDVNLSRLRQGRLARLRTELARCDCAACVLLDPINIRYATDARNMAVFMLRNPARYVFIPVEGPRAVKTPEEITCVRGSLAAVEAGVAREF